MLNFSYRCVFATSKFTDLPLKQVPELAMRSSLPFARAVWGKWWGKRQGGIKWWMNWEGRNASHDYRLLLSRCCCGQKNEKKAWRSSKREKCQGGREIEHVNSLWPKKSRQVAKWLLDMVPASWTKESGSGQGITHTVLGAVRTSWNPHSLSVWAAGKKGWCPRIRLGKMTGHRCLEEGGNG